MTIRSPVRWIGGKGRHVANILPLFPKHRCYVEPFGGGASVLLAKQPSEVEVYNDIDTNIVGLFKALKEIGEDVFTDTALTPYSRYEHIHSRTKLGTPHGCLVAYRQSFGGNKNSFGSTATRSKRQMAMTVSDYISGINKLAAVVKRFRGVTIHNEDATNVIQQYDSATTLFYVDPPYVRDSWKARDDLYEQTMSDEQHVGLLRLLKQVKGMVILSNYENALYERLSWTKYTFHTISTLIAKTRITKLKGIGSTEAHRRTECIWVNKALEKKL